MAGTRTSLGWRQLPFCLLVGVLVLSDMATGTSSTVTSATVTTRAQEETCDETTLVQEEPVRSSREGNGEMVLRLFLVRHGQTQANDSMIVVGQSDSPLSGLGRQQAQALGRTDLIRKERFWRRYTSDLGRAQATAQLVLSSSDDEKEELDSLGVLLEPRLRELAKGAREGLPKRISYEQAKVAFRDKYGETAPLPLLETEEEVWERFRDWLMEVMGDAVRAQRQQSPMARVYSVFVVLHAGTLRTALKYMVADQLPASVDLSRQTFDGSTSSHLEVPNTSVTIVDLHPLQLRNEIWDEERTTHQLSNQALTELWRARLQQLTWTDHYQHVQ